MPITVSGTQITFNDATTQSTAGITSAVTSAVAGNGIGVSGATGAVTFSAACPTFNTVGSYVFGGSASGNNSFTFTSGSNYSVGSSPGQVQSSCVYLDDQTTYAVLGPFSNNLSGTWKYMGSTRTTSGGFSNYLAAIFCRVS